MEEGKKGAVSYEDSQEAVAGTEMRSTVDHGAEMNLKGIKIIGSTGLLGSVFIESRRE